MIYLFSAPTFLSLPFRGFWPLNGETTTEGKAAESESKKEDSNNSSSTMNKPSAALIVVSNRLPFVLKRGKEGELIRKAR